MKMAIEHETKSDQVVTDFKMYLLLIMVLLVAWKGENGVICGNLDATASPAALNKLNVNEVILSKDHLHEDINDIIKLEESGELTSGQALFYFLTLHDFDKNGGLDGLELMVALRHAAEHEQIDKEILTENVIIAAVDEFFLHDTDFDGFITYSELRKPLHEQDRKVKVDL